MSWKLQALVADRVCGSITRKMVLLNMASRANDDGSGVFASLPMVAGWCEVDARTVRRVVRDLEAEGIITQCGWKAVKNGKINAWNVNVEAVESLPLYKDELAVKRAEKVMRDATPDTVSAVKKRRKKTDTYNRDPGHKVRADMKSGRTQSPATPDTVSASSIPEPMLFEEASASSNVVAIRAGDGQEAVRLFAEAAKRAGWCVPRVAQLSAETKRAVQARLREFGGLDGWREQIALAERQPFLAGDSDRGWRMNLKFFAKPSGWEAIAEQRYLGKARQSVSRIIHDQPSQHLPRGRGNARSSFTDHMLRACAGDQPDDYGRVESVAIK